MTYDPRYQPVGTCLQCRQPVYPPNYIAYQAGPMHTQCAQVANAQHSPKKSNVESIATAVVAIVMVLFFGTCVCVSSINAKKTKEAKAQEDKLLAEQKAKAALEAEAVSDHVSIGKNGFVWLGNAPTKNIFIFDTQDALDDFNKSESKNDKWGQIEAIKGAFFAAPNTEVTVIGGSIWTETSEIRILDGKHMGRKGVTYTSNVHRWRTAKQ